MLGLFGTLNMGANALQTQQRGIEVTGHNLANVNNPAYARQRLQIETDITIPGINGIQGTGVQSTGVEQIRSNLLDAQIRNEASVRGYLESEQSALQYAQALLGQAIDRQASGPEGTAAALGVGGQYGLAEGLSDLFNAFQAVANAPTDVTKREALLSRAQTLATQYNQVDKRLGELAGQLDASLASDVGNVNDLLKDIAELNQDIVSMETGSTGAANDLRDRRQQKLEELGRLVNYQVSDQDNGSMDIAIGGVTMVSGATVAEQLETYDNGAGHSLIRAAGSDTPLTLTGGKIQGTIDVRDGALQTLRDNVNSQAALLITEVNNLHRAGYSLTGTTGADFFTGTSAADIAVNSALRGDARLVQAAGVSDAVGNNSVALKLAQLASTKHASLNGQTFSENYGSTVAGFGQKLSSVNIDLEDQDVVERMLQRQRESISGVSIDEEMTTLMRFQKAFQASARLITTVDEMLNTVLALKA